MLKVITMMTTTRALWAIGKGIVVATARMRDRISGQEWQTYVGAFVEVPSEDCPASSLGIGYELARQSEVVMGGQGRFQEMDDASQAAEGDTLTRPVSSSHW